MLLAPLRAARQMSLRAARAWVRAHSVDARELLNKMTKVNAARGSVEEKRQAKMAQYSAKLQQAAKAYVCTLNYLQQ